MSNREIYEKARQAAMSQDFDTYRSYVADDCVNHNPAPGFTGKGGDAVVGEMKMWLTAFSGVESTPIQILEQGDLLAVHARAVGTHTGSIMGAPATNKKVDITTTEILRYKDGKVVERWGNIDMMAMLQQLGMMPGA